MAKFEEFSECY